MNTATLGLDFPETNGSVYEKLTAVFGELSDNLLSAIVLLPRDVRNAILAAEGNEAVRSVWDEYLAGKIAHLKPQRDEVSDFRAVHGHRYANSVDAALSHV